MLYMLLRLEMLHRLAYEGEHKYSHAAQDVRAPFWSIEIFQKNLSIY